MNNSDWPHVVIFSIASGALAFMIVLVCVSPKPTNLQPAAVVAYPAELSLSDTSLVAKAALLYDPTTRIVLYAKNSDAAMPLASLTKLVTAQAVLSAKSATSSVTIHAEDLAPEGDWGFMPGDVVTIADLVRFGLVASSNDAMAAAAASLGSEYLIKLGNTASKLGLTHALFLNPTGLDVNEETSGAYASAHDVALLASAFLHDYPDFLQSTALPSITIRVGDHVLTAKSTSLPLQDIAGFIGAKTGYTDLAGGNLVAAFDIDIGHPVIVVVLGSTEAGRFADVRTIINAARAPHTP